ncbi:MAG: ABC transporter permease [Eubacteriales bacterium]
MKLLFRLALRQIRTHRIRSAVICAAILLTTILFMTIMSISSNMTFGYQLMLELEAGTDVHAFLKSEAFTVPPEELRERVSAADTVSDSFLISSYSTFAFETRDLPRSKNRLIGVEAAEHLDHLFCTLTEGRFPADCREILFNEDLLPDAVLGDTVTLHTFTFTYTETGNPVAHEQILDFTLVGRFTCAASSPYSAITAWDPSLDTLFSVRPNVFLSFHSSINSLGKLVGMVTGELAEWRDPEVMRYGMVNEAYVTNNLREMFRPGTVLLIVFSVAVVFFCAFLLIYNIYSIALTQELHTFGLLNVIGMTHRQMKRLLAMQSLLLYAVTLPFGLAAGYFIGWKLLSPLLFSMSGVSIEYRFGALIPVSTALLTLGTLLYSALRPLKRMQKLTILETVSYNPALALPKAFLRKKNRSKKEVPPTPVHLAKFSMQRHRKRTVVTSLSSVFAIVLVILIASLADYIREYTYSHLQWMDFTLRPQVNYIYDNAPDMEGSTYAVDAGYALSEELFRSLEASEYAEKAYAIRYSLIELPVSEELAVRLEGLREEYLGFDQWYTLAQADAGTLHAVIVSVPDEYVPQLLLDNEEKTYVPAEEFLTGRQMLYLSYTAQGMRRADSSLIDFRFYRDGDVVSGGGLNNDYTVLVSDAATTSLLCGYLTACVYRPIFLLPESAFLAEFENAPICRIVVDAAGETAEANEQLRGEIERLAQSADAVRTDETSLARKEEENAYGNYLAYTVTDTEVVVHGRMDSLEEMDRNINAIRVVGFSLAGMIFLIGVINIVNAALSSVTERRTEYAILEAVGMTDRQLRRMMLVESLSGGVFAGLLTFAVGLPLTQLFLNCAMNASVSIRWLGGLVLLLLMLAVSVAASLTVYSLVKKSPVIDRIRQDG